ncbi:MAG: deoxyribose-phosphate aldolase [Hungatella hathewayi]|nr:deoxyribose-phosphate aldolase [Hungatella hathewayi]
MDRQKILKRVDHTLLAQTATWQEIKEICDDAVTYNTASVCIPPSYVRQAAEYLGERMPVCTVIGFPNGYNTTAVKCFETADAVAGGAKEIDMVVNLGWVKEGRYDLVKDEIQQIKKACDGRLLKVIIETCLLTEEEKKELCRVVTESDAEYIKTSTGFSTGGATFEDVELMRKYTGADKMVKAAGGIKDFADAERFVELGADRLGTSRLVKIMKE